MGRERNSHGGGCALCGGPHRHKQRAEVAAVCSRCKRGACAKHSRWVGGEPICMSCLRVAPDSVKRSAIRVG